MNEFEIHVEYDPKQDYNNWKVSYGDPVECFRVWKKHTALHYAKNAARENLPSRIIIHDQNGNVEKYIEYRSDSENNIIYRIKRHLFELTSSELIFSVFGSIVLIIILLLLLVPWVIWTCLCCPLIKLNRYLSERINAIPPLYKNFNKVRSIHHATHKTHLSKAPGTYLLAFVDFLFSPKTVELTFKQIVRDWRGEYFEALKQGRTWKAQWIMVRYRFSFACAFIKASGLNFVFSFFKQSK